MTKLPLVHQEHFAHATRETGYKSTAAAIAELVDNSLQAQATEVHIRVFEVGVGADREVTVGVWDNGCGMDDSTLQQAIQFGGSTRFNDRTGLGRFGMGLPNSSVSQARRLEVFTWQSRRRPIYSYLDLDLISAGRLKRVPAPKKVDLPSWAPPRGRSGTLVLWSKCDRLDYQKASTIARKLVTELGRMFRHHIWGGARIFVNGEYVRAIDPLLCHARAVFTGAVPYLKPLVYAIRVPGDNDDRQSKVVVRFSVLPVSRWHALPLEEKRRMGIVGGAGVSVVRAGREIAHGWYFMGGKRRQNYDDWWRCEVLFEPELDELFGVTHSKQGIRPRQEFSAILAADIEPIAKQLSTAIRGEFSKESANASDATARASEREWRLPRVATAPGMKGRRKAVTHLTYRIEQVDSSSPMFVDWKVEHGKLKMAVNGNHPFFKEFYSPLMGVEWAHQRLDLMLLAFARAVEATGSASPRELMVSWSDVLATFMGE